MLVLVFLDEQADDFHERGERVGFVVADFVHEFIEQGNEAPVFRLGVRDEDGVREFWPVGE